MSKFDWRLYPHAEDFLRKCLADLVSKNGAAQKVATQIYQRTSGEIFDFVDHLVLSTEIVDVEALEKIGFEDTKMGSEGSTVLRVKDSMLFPVVLRDWKKSEVALAVENIGDFQKTQAQSKPIWGKPNSDLRKLEVSAENAVTFSVFERRGSSDFIIGETDDSVNYAEVLKSLESRKREFPQPEEGFAEIEEILNKANKSLRKARLSDAFFRCERRFWESRNRAARVQKLRQDEVGMGWGNVDHLTFRSSRKNFSRLIRIFESLDLKARERFHAGAQAGWGAQILEDTEGRNVVFADVDLLTEEKEVDFAHEGLEPKDRLGTVGLWVGLHGESMLEAGMHHLAARFTFEALRNDLKTKGVGMMKPFSDFPFLKQAFTEPERWQVRNEKINTLANGRFLSGDQAVTFRSQGAVGSHLENIQRGQGFKGFNQNSVSAIIRWTNPLAAETKNA